MRGDTTLWLPGTDHAGIATQMMVERQLVSEGTSRTALGREAFEARVWQWRDQYGKAILDQMKRLGASVDWQREYFTMDSDLSIAVREAFTRLYHQGLIYRGAYVVNWCPGCRTAVSDLEVVHEETTGKLWEIRYPVAGPNGDPTGEFLTIATTRPETMLGDVAVAVHPEDERYLHLHGKTLILPLTGRHIPIVLDEWVSRDFGTGAVKITPAHDPNDFALGQRHHLPSINIMDDTAHIVRDSAYDGPYSGLDRFAARAQILDDLAAEGLLGAIHEHKLSIGRCDRSKDIIEPRLSTQWFVAVKKSPTENGQPTTKPSMADLAVASVQPDASGKKPIQFTPAMYEKTYLNWMENIYDWCISRQLWWGHRIPAWHCANCRQITVPQPGQSADPTVCAHCGKAELTQETDVLDTWFSSGLLPVSVFGWPFLQTKKGAGAPGLDFETGEGSTPKRTTEGGAPSIAPHAMGGIAEASPDFQTFYPTSLLVTGFDILFFWVARMIMLGVWFAQDVPLEDGSKRPLSESVPFREVYIHALVRDANREKMSKTKGNVIDPIEIVKQYGTDAVRFTLASMASPGTDIAFNIARTEGYRAFANKIWNAARFLFMNIDRAAEAGVFPDRNLLGGMPSVDDDAPLEDRWIMSELWTTAAAVNSSLENYRYDDAANTIYQFFWGSFCDWYLEIAKLRLDFSETSNKAATTASLTRLVQVFETSLRLLSPFMPFITEEIWHAIYDGEPPTESIALAHYPFGDEGMIDVPAVDAMALLQSLIVEVRALRKEIGVEEKASTPIEIRIDEANKPLMDAGRAIVERLGRVSEVRFVPAIAAGLSQHSTPSFDVAVIYEREIDVPAERERLLKEIAKLDKILTGSDKQLTNEAFLAKAPPAIVEGLKKQAEENRILRQKAQDALANLPTEPPPDTPPQN